MTVSLRISGSQRALRLSSSRLRAVFATDDVHQQALAGHAPAQAEYGQRLLRGDGVARNPREGRRWCRLAADQGNALGQFLLGSCYYNGEGGMADPLRAFMWFSLAAEQGMKDALVIRRLMATQLSEANLREAKRLVRCWRPEPARVPESKNGGNTCIH